MYIIVGLGNPGKEYEETRHNMGFMCIDRIAADNQINVIEKKHKALIGKGFIDGQKVVLVKPQTYMNNSGESVREVMDFYKIDPTDELLIIYDDIDLPVGKLRIRERGSAGGHNGIKSIIAHAGTQDFKRIKVGVGAKPEGGDLVNHVLGHFSVEDRPVVSECIDDVVEAVGLIVTNQIGVAMNRYN